MDHIISPINLLNPDRYEFYTVNQRGDIIKRLMTKNDVKSIAAGNFLQANVLMSFGEQQGVIKNVVSTIKDVLNTELRTFTHEDDLNPEPFENNISYPATMNQDSYLQQYILSQEFPSEINKSENAKNMTDKTHPKLSQNTEIDDSVFVANLNTEGSSDEGHSALTLTEEHTTERMPSTIQPSENTITVKSYEKPSEVKNMVSEPSLFNENLPNEETSIQGNSILGLSTTPSTVYDNNEDLTLDIEVPITTFKYKEYISEPILSTIRTTDDIVTDINYNTNEIIFNDILKHNLNIENSSDAAYPITLKPIHEIQFTTTMQIINSDNSDKSLDKTEGVLEFILPTEDPSTVDRKIISFTNFENKTEHYLNTNIDTYNKYDLVDKMHNEGLKHNLRTNHTLQAENTDVLHSSDKFNTNDTKGYTFKAEEWPGSEYPTTLQSLVDAIPTLPVFDVQNAVLELAESLSSNYSYIKNTQNVIALTEVDNTQQIEKSVYNNIIYNNISSNAVSQNCSSKTLTCTTEIIHKASSLASKDNSHNRITDSILEHGQTPAPSDKEVAMPNIENILKLLMQPTLNMDRYVSETATAASKIKYAQKNADFRNNKHESKNTN